PHVRYRPAVAVGSRRARAAAACGAVPVLLALGLTVCPAADASQLIDRDARNVTLKVDSRGRAMIEYRVGAKRRHVLAFGAVNARMPLSATKPVTPQVKF